MQSDIKQINPEKYPDIEFVTKDDVEFSIPSTIPSGAHLEILHNYDALLAFQSLSSPRPEDADIVAELKKNKDLIYDKADIAIREILSAMARPKYPEMSPEWFKENLDGFELSTLAAEVLLQASDFFVRRQKSMLRLLSRGRAINERAR